MIIGIDEVGRGAWAGPLTAAAVGLTPEAADALMTSGLADSKMLSATQRERLDAQIRAEASFISIKSVSVAEIDQHGVGRANTVLFLRLITACPEYDIVCDGRPCLEHPRVQFIIDGDALHPAIMAAAIVAKVSRDRLLTVLATNWPAYGFDRHKGYGTKLHQQALAAHGPTVHHRQSFKPIQALLG